MAGFIYFVQPSAKEPKMREVIRFACGIGASSASANCSCANSAPNGRNSCDVQQQKGADAMSALGTQRHSSTNCSEPAIGFVGGGTAGAIW